jgi:hypothetical protein
MRVKRNNLCTLRVSGVNSNLLKKGVKTMYTIREYNKLRVNYIPLQEQYELIRRYWGKRLLTIGVNKDDKRYITYCVRI